MLPRQIWEEPMKRLFVILLMACLLLSVGCKETETPISVVTEQDQEAAPSTTALVSTPTPEMLIGMWRSLDPGELDMIETITFEEDGTISVNCTYQGSDAGTIYGTYYVNDKLLHCDMTSNGAPYIIDYQFLLDGRELTLQDDDGPAHYIKVS